MVVLQVIKLARWNITRVFTFYVLLNVTFDVVQFVCSIQYVCMHVEVMHLIHIICRV